MYKLQLPNSITNEQRNFVLRLSDNAYVPLDPANTDYQAYLKWLEEGGVPEPADEPE